MRQLKIALGLALFALVLVPALRAQLMEQVVPGEVREFQIRLRTKGAAEGFTPFLVIVKPEDKVRFVVTSVDKDCNFEVKGLNVHEKLKKGVPGTINFTAPEEGKFDYFCAGMPVKHGIRHQVKGTLVVKKTANAAPASNGGA